MITWKSEKGLCHPFCCDFKLKTRWLHALQSSLFNWCSLQGAKLLLFLLWHKLVISPSGKSETLTLRAQEIHMAAVVIFRRVLEFPLP